MAPWPDPQGWEMGVEMGLAEPQKGAQRGEAGYWALLTLWTKLPRLPV